MKITLTELKQIIRQEVRKARILNENPDDHQDPAKVLKNELIQIINNIKPTKSDTVHTLSTKVEKALAAQMPAGIEIEESIDVDRDAYNGKDWRGNDIDYYVREYEISDEKEIFPFLSLEFKKNKGNTMTIEVNEHSSFKDHALKKILEIQGPEEEDGEDENVDDDDDLRENRTRRRNPRRFY